VIHAIHRPHFDVAAPDVSLFNFLPPPACSNLVIDHDPDAFFSRVTTHVDPSGSHINTNATHTPSSLSLPFAFKHLNVAANAVETPQPRHARSGPSDAFDTS
jgi:hypothetical protein